MNLRGRNKVSATFSMSSMTDIVFLLLVFFLLTSPAITPNALDLLLPEAKGKSTNQHQASVSITKEGAFFINKERIAKGQLESALSQVLNSVSKPTVILRAEQGVPIEQVVYVMDLANRRNYQVVLAVNPK
ncbi:MAG: biopolymer transporter ExbD [Bacteroidetes bacterium]|jgi:biopolymer transport protein ExbD|nr:biopolymer transporter ExbD [Flavobacteriaceae bacterium]MDA0720042.1 biopolymer transporter ExbD [Bacteroidota bacterium]MDA0864106.1 biopolymer transporter ExbD [Bacteroidota bacterium]MDA1209555.1 biopolymer transporter ExbD [Bacteroidota bacterium]HCK05548.1 biopolymer transporter ExbD [Flavobacteriaceae bacterium]